MLRMLKTLKALLQSCTNMISWSRFEGEV